MTYPASLSRKLENVIPVTTLSPNFGSQVSPNQNFSEQVVYIGVNADKFASDVPTNDCVFLDPINNNRILDGTSFATPIATGKIAAFFPLLPISSGSSREGLLTALQSLNLIRILPPGAGPGGALSATPPKVNQNRSMTKN